MRNLDGLLRLAKLRVKDNDELQGLFDFRGDKVDN